MDAKKVVVAAVALLVGIAASPALQQLEIRVDDHEARITGIEQQPPMTFLLDGEGQVVGPAQAFAGAQAFFWAELNSKIVFGSVNAAGTLLGLGVPSYVLFESTDCTGQPFTTRSNSLADVAITSFVEPGNAATRVLYELGDPAAFELRQIRSSRDKFGVCGTSATGSREVIKLVEVGVLEELFPPPYHLANF